MWLATIASFSFHAPTSAFAPGHAPTASFAARHAPTGALAPGHAQTNVRRAASPRLTASTPPLIIAFDLDGVIVDSEPELTQTAWRTACRLWPALMEETAGLVATPAQLGARKAWTQGSWDELRGTGDEGLPNWLRAKLRLLRPVVETGFEALLMLRLCAEEAISAGPRKRPLTIGEMTVNWGPELRETLLLRYGIDEPAAVAAFGATRDEWIAADEAGWLGANGFYEGALDVLREALDSEATVYIVTTKQTRFARQLLCHAGMPVPEESIFGLGSGPKADTLATLRQRHPDATIRFVEDKVRSRSLYICIHRFI